jgi:hypothetical protein
MKLMLPQAAAGVPDVEKVTWSLATSAPLGFVTWTLIDAVLLGVVVFWGIVHVGVPLQVAVTVFFGVICVTVVDPLAPLLASVAVIVQLMPAVVDDV